MSREPSSGPVVLDVIENALGCRPTRAEMEALSISELEELNDRLSEFWEAQHDEPVRGDAVLLGGWMGAFWSEQMLRTELSDSLLYYSSLVVLDPLADYFGDRAELPEPRPIRFRRSDGRHNSVVSGPLQWSSQGTFPVPRESQSEAATNFARIVSNLYELESLIRAGVVILRSQWPTLAERSQQLATSVRKDIRSPEMQAFVRSEEALAEGGFTVWDNMRGLEVHMDLPVHTADGAWQAQHAFYYLAKVLAVADAAGAQYVPTNELDLGLLRLKVSASIRQSHPGSLLREVSRVLVPSADIPVREALAIRESSPNFEDWRSALSNLRRVTSAADGEELRRRVEDELRPRVRSIERDLDRTSLSASVRKDGASMIIDGAIGLGAAVAAGESVVGVGAAFASGAVRWVHSAYTREQPEGADAVLAALVNSSAV
jgi:hypothetical protein